MFYSPVFDTQTGRNQALGWSDVGASVRLAGPFRGPKTLFRPWEADFGAIWENRFFDPLDPLLTLGHPVFAPSGAYIGLVFAISPPNMGFETFWRGGNMFYSLGELQLWVFHQRRPNSGREIEDFVHFGRIFGPSLVHFAHVEGCRAGIHGRRGGRNHPAEVPKSVSRHRKPILGRFGKINFLTHIDQF